jgi:OmpA-OmpF porin, OOP family
MIKTQKLIAIVSGVAGLFIAASAQATVPGPYLGLQIGWGTIHQPNFSDNTNHSDGVAGMAFGGMQFNEYLGVELGYTKFSNMNTSASDGFSSANGTIKSYATDLVAKVTLPLQNGLNLYGKVGGAYLWEQATVTVTDGPFRATDRNTESKIMPAFGLGASYDINSNVTGDLAWMHIQKVGNTDLANTDFVGLGLTYHFG